MKKEYYQKPTTDVVKLQNTGILMDSKTQQVQGLIATMNGQFTEEDIPLL